MTVTFKMTVIFESVSKLFTACGVIADKSHPTRRNPNAQNRNRHRHRRQPAVGAR